MWEFNIYLTKTNGGSTIFQEWEKLNAGRDIESFEDFVKIYAFFRKAQASFGVRKKLSIIIYTLCINGVNIRITILIKIR